MADVTITIHERVITVRKSQVQFLPDDTAVATYAYTDEMGNLLKTEQFHIQPDGSVLNGTGALAITLPADQAATLAAVPTAIDALLVALSDANALPGI